MCMFSRMSLTWRLYNVVDALHGHQWYFGLQLYYDNKHSDTYVA